VKDCVLVCSGVKEKDIPYVAKVTNFWEELPEGLFAFVLCFIFVSYSIPDAHGIIVITLLECLALFRTSEKLSLGFSTI